ncbi:MAG: tetratricopeptide repeat protein [Acidobacteria bacterium]|nr:tetratricopeptide repeat protein [Acidobacteriota bacterium]
MKRTHSLIRWRRPFPIQSAAVAIIFACAVFTLSVLANDLDQIRTESFRDLVKRGDKLKRKGDLEAAEKAYRAAVAINPEDADVKLKLASALLKQRRLREAYDLSYGVAEADRQNAAAFALLGTAMLAAGRFQDARALFYNALKLDRKEALAWAGYGMLDFYENRIESSLENLWQAVFYDPDEPDYVFALAQVSSRAEKFKQAADSYYRFLEISKSEDDERRARIKGLINFLRFLGQKSGLYTLAGKNQTAVVRNR